MSLRPDFLGGDLVPRCSPELAEAFFVGADLAQTWEENHDANEYAKSICRRCPLIDACRAWAFAHPNELGVWGGTTAHERRMRLRRSA